MTSGRSLTAVVAPLAVAWVGLARSLQFAYNLQYGVSHIQLEVFFFREMLVSSFLPGDRPFMFFSPILRLATWIHLSFRAGAPARTLLIAAPVVEGSTVIEERYEYRVADV